MSKPTPTPQQNDIAELRASVDVMFEALSHIQASLTGATSDEHESAYHNFKQALYDRYEHALAQRREEHPTAPKAANGGADGGAREASAPMPGQGDGSQMHPPELEPSSGRDRAAGAEGETEEGPTLWPTD